MRGDVCVPHRDARRVDYFHERARAGGLHHGFGSGLGLFEAVPLHEVYPLAVGSLKQCSLAVAGLLREPLLDVGRPCAHLVGREVGFGTEGHEFEDRVCHGGALWG